MAVVQLTPEDRERYLLRTFQAAFHTLAEFAAKHPARAANVYANIAAHVRSAAPMALLDTGPVVLQAPAYANPASQLLTKLERSLPDGHGYELAAHAEDYAGGDQCMLLTTHDEADRVVLAMTPVETQQFVRDIADILVALQGAKR